MRSRNEKRKLNVFVAQCPTPRKQPVGGSGAIDIL